MGHPREIVYGMDVEAKHFDLSNFLLRNLKDFIDQPTIEGVSYW